MTSVDLVSERQNLAETLDQLIVPAEVREHVLALVGEQLAEAVQEQDQEKIQEGIDRAWIAVSNHYRDQVALTMEAWVAGGLINQGAADRMIERIPDGFGSNFAGLDAGVAAAMGIVPEDKQNLIRALHAFYTPDAVEQVRGEIAEGLNSEHETSWWLSMSSLCLEQQVDARTFVQQVADAMALKDDTDRRVAAADGELEAMKGSVEKIEAGIGYGDKDGCIQGAYLNGCDVGVCDMRELDAPIFVGTFRGSEVDLNGFEWGTEKDDSERPMSGQIAPGFYKVADEAELDRLIQELKDQLQI
jgi:hypothetical protein